MFSPRVVTLGIEATRLRVMVSRGRRIVRWAGASLEPGLVRDGLVLDTAKVGSAIDSLFRERKIPRERVYVSLTGLRSVTRVLTLPKLKSILLEEAIRNEAGREMPVPLEELYLTWHRLGINGSGETRFFVLGVPRNLVDGQLKALREAGIRPYGIGLKPLALVRAVNREEAVIIDLEPDNFDIVVVMDGFPVIMRSLVLRSGGMTIEEKVRHLMREFSRIADFYNNSHPQHPLTPATPVVLTGGLGGDSAIRETIKGAIANPIEAAAPALEYPRVLPVPEYAVNMGLALGQTSARGSRARGKASLSLGGVNVLPEAYRPHRISSKHVLYPLAAALSLALLASLYLSMVSAGAEMGRVHTELAHVNAQLLRAQEMVNTIKEVEAEVKRINDERGTLLEEDPLGEDFRLILQALPPGVRLASISQTVSGVSLGGTADSDGAVLDYARALEQRENFSAAYVTSLSREGETSGPRWVTFSIAVDK